MIQELGNIMEKMRKMFPKDPEELKNKKRRRVLWKESVAD